jgi:hypothetical protein
MEIGCTHQSTSNRPNPSYKAVSGTKEAIYSAVLRELSNKQPVEQAMFLVDNVHHLTNVLHRLWFRFQVCRHGDRNTIKFILYKVKVKIIY